ncbi:MAG: TfpX/TfpZ family type IV pilin accessory protein [Burkholderiales bacterium]
MPPPFFLSHMNRWKAFSLHLGISATIGTLVVGTMLLVWYPGPFFTAMGGNDLVVILLGVDVVLGPLVTLVIFNPGKGMRLLRMDLAIIGTIQALALAYGVHVIAEVRPVYMVFTVDRFDLVAANDLREAELARVADPAFQGVPWGRPRTIAVSSPADPREQMRIIESAMAGADLQTFPQYYVKYEALAARALKVSKPIAVLRKRHPEESARIDRELAALGRREEELRFLPLKARSRDYCVLLDARDGAVAGFLELIPW